MQIDARYVFLLSARRLRIEFVCVLRYHSRNESEPIKYKNHLELWLKQVRFESHSVGYSAKDSTQMRRTCRRRVISGRGHKAAAVRFYPQEHWLVFLRMTFHSSGSIRVKSAFAFPMPQAGHSFFGRRLMRPAVGLLISGPNRGEPSQANGCSGLKCLRPCTRLDEFFEGWNEPISRKR